MSMDLFQLPEPLILSLLTDWLDCRCWPRLDVALCSSTSRNPYLNALQSKFTVIPTLDAKHSSDQPVLMKWIADRRLRLQGFQLRHEGLPDPASTKAFWSSVQETLVELYVDRYDAQLNKALQKAHMSLPHLHCLHVELWPNTPCTALWSILDSCANCLRDLNLVIQGPAPAFPWSINRKFPNLIRLHLHCEHGFDELEWQFHLLERCPRLLSFTYCGDLSPETSCLSTLAAHCPQLQELHCECGSPTPTSLINVLLSCRGLHTIDFMASYEISPQHLAALVQHGASIRAFRTQRAESYIVSLLCPWISQLQHLALDSLDCESDAPIQLIAQHCGQLESLSLQELSGASAGALVELFTRLPRLAELDLASAYAVSNDVLLAIAKHCPRLRRICLDGFPRNSSADPDGKYSCNTSLQEGFTAMLTGCRELREVCMMCYDSALKRSFQALRPDVHIHGDFLDFGYCSHWKASAEFARWVESRCPEDCDMDAGGNDGAGSEEGEE
jgi:hypothetical protein